jgi:hypothetical protein
VGAGGQAEASVLVDGRRDVGRQSPAERQAHDLPEASIGPLQDRQLGHVLRRHDDLQLPVRVRVGKQGHVEVG